MRNAYDVIASVHDEIISEIPEDDRQEHNLEVMCEIMSYPPGWALGLPINAEGEVLKRYKKL
jgi:DNA polymerase